jgi:hypothetical protein
MSSLCCCAAVLISDIRSLTRRTLVTISSMVRPALQPARYRHRHWPPTHRSAA